MRLEFQCQRMKASLFNMCNICSTAQGENQPITSLQLMSGCRRCLNGVSVVVGARRTGGLSVWETADPPHHNLPQGFQGSAPERENIQKWRENDLMVLGSSQWTSFLDPVENREDFRRPLRMAEVCRAAAASALQQQTTGNTSNGSRGYRRSPIKINHCLYSWVTVWAEASGPGPAGSNKNSGERFLKPRQNFSEREHPHSCKV